MKLDAAEAMVKTVLLLVEEPRRSDAAELLLLDIVMEVGDCF